MSRINPELVISYGVGSDGRITVATALRYTRRGANLAVSHREVIATSTQDTKAEPTELVEISAGIVELGHLERKHPVSLFFVQGRSDRFEPAS